LCEQPEEVGVLLLQESKPLALKRETDEAERQFGVRRRKRFGSCGTYYLPPSAALCLTGLPV
jgi:hypothetical protein